MTRHNETPDAASVASLVHGSRPLNIAIVGATGNVGSTLLEVLAERGFPIKTLRALASERSAGNRVQCGAHEAVVEVLDSADISGIDVAFFAAGGSISQKYAPLFTQAGAIVIDNSSAFRGDDDIPLIVPEVNGGLLTDIPKGIIANPNCSTIQLVTVLRPIQDTFELDRVSVTTMQSTSGTGHKAMQELEHQARVVMGVAANPPEVYPHEIAFNVLPHCDDFLANGFTKEEEKLVNESRKILDLPDLRLVATCTRVPVFVGHSEAVHLELKNSVTLKQLNEALQNSPGVELLDNPAENEYPTPRDAAGQDDVFVGRVRLDPTVPNDRGVALFIVADNLRKGAATNAVQILETLASIGYFPEKNA